VTALLLAVLAASLLGSLHCVGMCGGMVSLVATARGPGCGPSRWGVGLLDQGLYHLARGAGYVAIGLTFGALGAGADRLGAFVDVQRVAATSAGVLMLAWGLHALLEWRGLVRGLPSVGGGAVARVFSFVTRRGPRARVVLLGALTPLLPCGWLWLFAASAAGTGSALGGGLVLATFWAGTVPALLGLGLGLRAAAGRLRDHLPWIRGVTLVVVGLLTLTGRATLSAPSAPAHEVEPTSLERIETAPTTPLPCCDRHES
jgi:sulfite exporter TauE/SafE